MADGTPAETAAPVDEPAAAPPSEPPAAPADGAAAGSTARPRRPATAGSDRRPLSRSLPTNATNALGNSARLSKTGSVRAVEASDGGGPGAYDPQKVGAWRSPSFSFGRPKDAPPPTSPRQRPSTASPKADDASKASLAKTAPLAGKSAAPGPGSHDPKFLKQQRAPAYSFGNQRISGPVSASSTPGPGSYDVKPIGQSRAPAFAMGTGKDNSPPKPRPTVAEPSPGPGEAFGGPLVVGADKKKKGGGWEPRTAPGAPADASAGAPAAAAGSTAPTTGSAGFAENLAGAVDVDWEALSAKLPTGKDPASTKRRKELWKRSDPNGNGYLSSAEVDLMVKEAVGEALFSAKPVIQAAFHAARRSGGGEQSGAKSDYVERSEFRTLLIALRQYYELYAMFNRLDTTDDRRIEVGEFKKGLAFIEKWGVKIEEAQVQQEFDSIDENGGGFILFDEFSHWAIQKALDLPEDDDFQAGQEVAEDMLEGQGYAAEKGRTKGGLFGREPHPKLCYSHMGAVVPLQTTAKFEPRSPQSNPTVNRMRRSVEMPPEHAGGLKMLGGLPHRQLRGSKFTPHHPIPPKGAPAGLPFAFGQMLLEAAQKDFEERYGKPEPTSAAGLLTGPAKGAGAPQQLKQKPPDQKEGDWQDVDGSAAAAAPPEGEAAAAAPAE